jgi:hypothetical protein
MASLPLPAARTVEELDPGFVVKDSTEWKDWQSYRGMEVIVKARLLLTSALLMFVQIPAPQAQVTVDVAKITCEQFSMEELSFNSRDVIFWISGYYHREHNNTVIEPGAIKRDANNLNRYCYQHGEMTVMDALKNMGLGK